MPVDLLLDLVERKRRVGAILRQHVEADLRVEYFLRQRLERKQRDGLLLKLFNPGLTPLADRFENFDHGTADRSRLLEMRQKQGQRDGSGMRDGLNRRVRFEPGSLHHGRTQARFRQFLQAAADVDDRGSLTSPPRIFWYAFSLDAFDPARITTRAEPRSASSMEAITNGSSAPRVRILPPFTSSESSDVTSCTLAGALRESSSS